MKTFKDDQEALKYHAARECYLKRQQHTPGGKLWAAWFESKYGESLEDYARRMRDEP